MRYTVHFHQIGTACNMNAKPAETYDAREAVTEACRAWNAERAGNLATIVDRERRPSAPRSAMDDCDPTVRHDSPRGAWSPGEHGRRMI